MKLLFSILILLLGFYLNGQTNVEYWLQARMNGVYELENGTEVEFWGYGDNTPPLPGNKIFLPGPILRFKEGDSAVVHFKNNSPEMHTIHFHGLDVNQANDGVGHTSQDILPNQTFDYKFKCTHAGTFLYHCHVLTTLHLAMGMYGMVIVDPPGGTGTLNTNTPVYSEEYPLLASEFNLNWNQNPISPGPFHLYEANYFMINGKSGAQLQSGDHDIIGQLNTFIALRFANVSYSRVQYTLPSILEVSIVNSDGRRIPNNLSSGILDVYPGERFDVLVKSSTLLDSFLTVSYFDLRNDNLLGSNLVPIKIGANESFQTNSNQFHLWPNPVDGILNCNNPSNETIAYEICALDGVAIQNGNLKPGVQSLPIELVTGIYFLKTPAGACKFVVK